MSEVNVEQLERQLVDTKAQVEMGNAVARLLKNPDYRKVIEDGFMLHECARYVQQSANPAIDERGRADALAIAQASGHLKRYLSVTLQIANQCENSIPDIESAIEEARIEEDSEE